MTTPGIVEARVVVKTNATGSLRVAACESISRWRAAIAVGTALGLVSGLT